MSAEEALACTVGARIGLAEVVLATTQQAYGVRPDKAWVYPMLIRCVDVSFFLDGAV